MSLDDSDAWWGGDEPVPRQAIPDGAHEWRIVWLLQHYYPLPLSPFDISEVLELPARIVKPLLRDLVRDGVIVAHSSEDFAAKEGRE